MFVYVLLNKYTKRPVTGCALNRIISICLIIDIRDFPTVCATARLIFDAAQSSLGLRATSFNYCFSRIHICMFWYVSDIVVVNRHSFVPCSTWSLVHADAQFVHVLHCAVRHCSACCRTPRSCSCATCRRRSRRRCTAPPAS